MAQESPARPSGPPLILPSPAVEPTARWIRVQFGGMKVADSKRALLLIQYGPGGLPTYYFPQADVRMDLLEPVAPEQPTDDKLYYRINVGDHVADRAAWVYQNPPHELAALKEYVSFAW